MSRFISIIALLFLSLLSNGQVVDKIIEYTPAPGQFINTASGNPVAAESLTAENGGLVSLGGFGGYIIVRLSEAIENNKDNPYGVDFSIFGNAIPDWSEPGIVSVMRDDNGNGVPDEKWYELAGSDYFFPETDPDYHIIYSNPKSTQATDVPWTDNRGGSGFIRTNMFQFQPYYPDPGIYSSIGEEKAEFSGRRIFPVVDLSNPSQEKSFARGFGYADNNYRIDPNNPLPDNPYTRQVENSGGDGMDISWAIDDAGDYVELDEIHFLRICTGVNASGNVLGELSTEVSLIRDVMPEPGYPMAEKYIALMGLPRKIFTGEYILSSSVFISGKYDNTESVTWSVVNGVAEIMDNNRLVAEYAGELELSASLDSDPSINVQIITEVMLVNRVDAANYRGTQIYPNPAGDYAVLRNDLPGYLELISASGQLLFSDHTPGGVYKLETSHYPTGLYFIRIRMGEKFESHTLQIVH